MNTFVLKSLKEVSDTLQWVHLTLEGPDVWLALTPVLLADRKYYYKVMSG